MSETVATWPRRHYEPGGGDPLLFYVVYGEINVSTPLSPSKYRSRGVPDGIDLMTYDPDGHPEVAGSFRQGYAWDEFEKVDPSAASQVAECERCMVLRGTPRDDSSLNYLRDCVGLLTYLLDGGGVAIYDPQIFRWWQPGSWRRDVFQPAAPVPGSHVVILVSQEEDPSRKWFHTRGLRKFGRPDISVHDVPAGFEEGVIDLCNRLIDIQARGAVIPEGQQINIPSLPEGAVMRHRGDLDDPDFNNVHLDIRWPGDLASH